MKDALPYLSLLAVLVSIGLSFWVASRAGSWRNSDELRDIETSQSKLESRIAVVENQVTSEIGHLKAVAQRLEAAVARMEGFFMRPPS